MKVNLRTKTIEDKNKIKERLENNNILNYTDDNLFNNLIYIFDVSNVLYYEFSIIIETNERQIAIENEFIEFMSINQNED